MCPKLFRVSVGISASDSDIGYVIWGDPLSRRDVDGTVVPCAAGGSLMFSPEICLPALRYMHQQFAPYVYGRYGFADAFNPQTLWVDPDVVGIDVGITLLSAENLRSGRVWRWFNRSPDVDAPPNNFFRCTEQLTSQIAKSTEGRNLRSLGGHRHRYHNASGNRPARL